MSQTKVASALEGLRYWCRYWYGTASFLEVSIPICLTLAHSCFALKQVPSVSMILVKIIVEASIDT